MGKKLWLAEDGLEIGLLQEKLDTGSFWLVLKNWARLIFGLKIGQGWFLACLGQGWFLACFIPFHHIFSSSRCRYMGICPYPHMPI
jgi:hypothetical protein